MDKYRRISAYINGTSLTDAAPLAIIRQVTENPAESELTTGERPGREGQSVVGFKRTRLNITIDFALRNIFDLEARASDIEAAAAWAQNGILELSNKPGRQLRVIVTKRPVFGAARDYNQVYSAEFAAIACPYWQDRGFTAVTKTGTTGSAALNPPGTVERLPLEFTITPASAAMTSLTVTVNGKSIAFSGITVASGKKLKLYYDENNLQWITNDGSSALQYRTAASADDLFVYPKRSNTITFTANTAVTAEFRARGLYL